MKLMKGKLMASMNELLNTGKQKLKDAEEVIGSKTTLSESEAITVAGKLADAEDAIDTILDPAASPSLDPPGAGSVISGTPADLPAYAATCADYGAEAHTNWSDQTPDDDYIGSRLKTIAALLPGYRTAAGI